MVISVHFPLLCIYQQTNPEFTLEIQIFVPFRAARLQCFVNIFAPTCLLL